MPDLTDVPNPDDPNFFVGGEGPKPVAFIYQKETLVEAGSDLAQITVEKNTMLGADGKSTDTSVLVTLYPLYARPQYSATAPEPGVYAMGPGKAKEYATLRVTMQQLAILPQVQPGQLLSWSNIWSFIPEKKDQRGDDVLEQGLGAIGQGDTFKRMPLPDGTAIVQVNFTTGTLNNDTGIVIGNIFRALGFLQSALSAPGTSALAIPATTLAMVSTYENLILAAMKAVNAGSTFARVMKPDGIDVAAHYDADSVNVGATLRLANGVQYTVFIPETQKAAFIALQATLSASSKYVGLDLGTGAPTIYGPPAVAGGKPTLTPADQDALQPFTMVTIASEVRPGK